MLNSLRTKYQDILKAVYLFAGRRGVRLYLVGGILRDALLNREKDNLDFDFCLEKNAISFGSKLAKESASGFVVLDKERGACRLVKKAGDKIYTLDFTDFRGKTLKDDLLRRDFTINSLALELEDVFAGGNLEDSLIDPYQGRRDLKAKVIRVVESLAFDEDALRILRAFSLASALGFKIDKETLRLIKSGKERLAGVSRERIRDELFKILDRDGAFDYLLTLDKLKILKIILPEIELMRGVRQGPYHHLDVLRHSLEAVRQLENYIKELKDDKGIRDYLDENISSERKRRALIKLGALLHDIGKPLARRREEGKTKFHGHERIGLEISEGIAKRLRLSNDELDSLKKMVFWHLRPGYLADTPKITPRAKFRYFRDTAQEGLSVLLISVADQRATRGPLTSKKSRVRHEEAVRTLIKEYFRKKKEKRPPRLISGDDLLKKFKLAPSPLIGRILCELQELQAIGRISSKKEAMAEAGKLLETSEK